MHQFGIPSFTESVIINEFTTGHFFRVYRDQKPNSEDSDMDGYENMNLYWGDLHCHVRERRISPITDHCVKNC